MKITIENYEAHALDFLEGSLGHQEEREFRKFLEQHPEIKEELVGVDQIVVIPDLDMQYPQKKSLYRKQRGGIIPLWNSSWMIAAAIALLIGSVTILFFKNTSEPTGYTITDNQPSTTETPTDIKELPATKPMPVEQPETDVMAQQGIVPGQEDHSDDSSPALTFGQTTEDIQSATHEQTGETKGKNIDQKTDLAEQMVLQPIQSHEPQELETDPVDVALTERAPIPRPEPIETVAFLPVAQSSVNAPSSMALPAINWETSEESTQFEIHIPGRFLSETWTDVSLNDIKSKILPEFLSTRNNK